MADAGPEGRGRKGGRVSGPHPLPELTCRKCGRSSPWVYFAPVVVEGTGTCICTDCAEARGWLDRLGNIKPGITL